MDLEKLKNKQIRVISRKRASALKKKPHAFVWFSLDLNSYVWEKWGYDNRKSN